MFTGLVRGIGRVHAIERRGSGVRLEIEAPDALATPAAGDSIAVMGCCLTLAQPASNRIWAFDVIAQTLRETTLGGLTPGSPVNVEPSLRAGDELGGHMVQGHIDGVGEVVSVQTGDDWRVRVRPPAGMMPLMVPRGSVCLDGVSLTLAEVDVAAREIEVALIPTTLRETTLDGLSVGDRVNLESDMMARTVLNYVRHYAAGGE